MENPFGKPYLTTLGRVADELVKYKSAIEKVASSPIVKRLGSGTQGDAYLLRNGKVLKLTKDTSEAMASEIMLSEGNPSKNVVKFYRVFEVDDLGIYGIVEERLNPTPDKFGELIHAVSAACSPKFSNTLSEPNDTILYRIAEKYGKKLTKQEANIALQLVNGLKALSKYGVLYSDLAASNTGMANNTIKIFDLGYSWAPRVKIPKVKNERLTIQSFLQWLAESVDNAQSG